MNPTVSSTLNNKALPSDYTPPASTSVTQPIETVLKTNTHDRATVTTSASQLSDAALRAQTTYGHYTKQQLKDMDINTSDLLAGNDYNSKKIKHDAEIPNTQDPALLERAKQATLYANGLGKNPFSGMPRDQLELIIYDDSGSFTINERRAALYEESDQDYAWRRRVVDDYFENRNSPGKAAEFYQTVLDYHRALPLVARSAAPEGYEAKLEEWIELELNVTNPTSDNSKKTHKNLTPEIAQRILEQDSSLFKTAQSLGQIGEVPTLNHPAPSLDSPRNT